jgi:hypothetical protein
MSSYEDSTGDFFLRQAGWSPLVSGSMFWENFERHKYYVSETAIFCSGGLNTDFVIAAMCDGRLVNKAYLGSAQSQRELG